MKKGLGTRLLAVAAASLASSIVLLPFAYSASATNENYNCNTEWSHSTCPFTYSHIVWLTNDFAVDYSHSGVCAATAKSGRELFWAKGCTSGQEILVCNGGEYEFKGEGWTLENHGTETEDNLAGTVNNFKTCKH